MGDGAPDLVKQAMEMHKEAGVNWRYWGDVRFKQLTLFLSLTGALGAAGLSKAVTESRALTVTLAALGVLQSILFFVLEERATYYRRRFVEVAKTLGKENPLVIQLYERTMNPWRWTSDKVYRAFFACVIGMWVALAAERLYQEAWAGVVAGAVGWSLFRMFGNALQSPRPSAVVTVPAIESISEALPETSPNEGTALRNEEGSEPSREPINDGH